MPRYWGVILRGYVAGTDIVINHLAGKIISLVTFRGNTDVEFIHSFI